MEPTATGADGLLATKLFLPPERTGFVARPRLLTSIEQGLTRGLVVVSASAGFGKTALVADWVRHTRRRAAWLSLDAGDNDPARFWRHALAAIDGVRPGIAEPIAPLLGPPTPSSYDGVVTVLINQLSRGSADEELVLVLDDYHLI